MRDNELAAQFSVLPTAHHGDATVSSTVKSENLTLGDHSSNSHPIARGHARKNADGYLGDIEPAESANSGVRLTAALLGDEPTFPTYCR